MLMHHPTAHTAPSTLPLRAPSRGPPVPPSRTRRPAGQYKNAQKARSTRVSQHQKGRPSVSNAPNSRPPPQVRVARNVRLFPRTTTSPPPEPAECVLSSRPALGSTGVYLAFERTAEGSFFLIQKHDMRGSRAASHDVVGCAASSCLVASFPPHFLEIQSFDVSNISGANLRLSFHFK